MLGRLRALRVGGEPHARSGLDARLGDGPRSLLIALPIALFAPVSQLTPRTVGLIALAGAANVLGLLVEYVAFRRGKVGVISAIASTEGVIAAVIAVVLGAHLALGTGCVLLVVAAGVVLAAATPTPPPPRRRHPLGRARDPGRAAVRRQPVRDRARRQRDLGALGAGAGAPARNRVPARTAARARRRCALTGRALPLVGAAAAAEVVGIISYELGARHGIAVAAVISSQFAALAALGAFFVMRERLTRLQLSGLASSPWASRCCAAIQS